MDSPPRIGGMMNIFSFFLCFPEKNALCIAMKRVLLPRCNGKAAKKRYWQKCVLSVQEPADLVKVPGLCPGENFLGKRESGEVCHENCI